MSCKETKLAASYHFGSYFLCQILVLNFVIKIFYFDSISLFTHIKFLIYRSSKLLLLPIAAGSIQQNAHFMITTRYVTFLIALLVLDLDFCVNEQQNANK